MELYLKITAGLLLLVQAFHLASLQESTDSPGRTKWLREIVKKGIGSQNATEEKEYDERADATAIESNNEYSGIASGSMAVYTEEEENVANQDKGAKESEDPIVVTTAVPPTSPKVTTKQPGFLDATVSPTTATTSSTKSSQINMTEAKGEFHNPTTTPQTSTTQLNSTSVPDYSNHTDLQTTTLVPKGNAKQESTTKPREDTGLTNATKSTNTTTATTRKVPEINETSTTSSSTTVFLSETTETSPATSTATAPNTPEKANMTDESSDSRSGSERGLASDPQNSKRHGAWGAVLGTAVAVVCVALVAYVILKNKCQQGFSHRKLVEDYPSDPVLRLDNGEPLDLNFGGSAYYNPGLQGDNIQMTNFPGRH